MHLCLPELPGFGGPHFVRVHDKGLPSGTGPEPLSAGHVASVVLHEHDPESLKEYGVSFFTKPSLCRAWKKSVDGKMFHYS